MIKKWHIGNLYRFHKKELFIARIDNIRAVGSQNTKTKYDYKEIANYLNI